MDDDPVSGSGAEQTAQEIAPSVRQVLLPQQGIAEGQPGRNPVFLHQRQHIPGVIVSETNPSPTPDAVCRGTINGADLTPVKEIFPVLPKQGQETAVQLIKLEQPRKVKKGCRLAQTIHLVTP